jgi:hypothetical protein
MDVARQARADWKARALPMGERRPLLLRKLHQMYGGAS